MTIPFLKIRSKPSRRGLVTSPQQRQRLTVWLVEDLPHIFDQILQWLSRGQLLLLMVCLLLLFIPLITARPPIWQQGLLGFILFLVGRVIIQMEEDKPKRKTSEYLHLLLILLSAFTTLRYFYYRTRYTLNFEGWLNIVFCLLLYGAEFYAIATLFLAYFQTLKIKQRKAVNLENKPQDEWFSVDIYIPTYNEDIEIVRKTTLAAVAIDYPADKKSVYVLDDGRKYPERREKLRQMCEDLGSELLTRDNNDHAKAGNINTAFHNTKGDLVLILDCDHIPAKSLLKETVGFFFNPKVSFVQTPHWFYNPDPFERNLLTEGRIPVGNELFYKVLQKGNDFWNAAFFCGSAAVIRKTHVMEIGGIATETVTEDCHTAFRLHSKGYESVYYDKIMVAGLAPEKFSAYIGQQVRWARGMAQILRLENPLFNRKVNLSLAQRLCYMSATSHFFFGFPRLMYAIAPTLFLLFGINSVKGLGFETLCYALPHVILSMQTNHIPYKHVRFSFWNEIFEFALSFQAGIVTILALINPKLGSFNVTDKGMNVTKRSFDFDSVKYLVLVAALAAAALFTVPLWLWLRPEDSQAVIVNVFWSIFNLILLMAACLVAFEQPQLRRAHRMPRKLTAVIHTPHQSWRGETVNISESGVQILLNKRPNIPDEIRVELEGDYGHKCLVRGRVMREVAMGEQVRLFVDFINLTRTQQDDLVLVIYSDVNEWYSQRRSETDHPLQSLKFIATSIRRVFREFRPAKETKVRQKVQTAVQLYWDYWKNYSVSATITEIGTHDLRLELDGSQISNLDTMQHNKPLISLLVTQESNHLQDVSFLAVVETIEQLVDTGSVDSIAIELSFPESIKQQQRLKIRQLLDSLD
ncbi:UDP-forming cellulose synthase catalytic subunit [Moorena sp. SIOASIH]|uniref:UDP-forming cellulose synthase catalytic subunit n=1 Tax=Moorena sp. SIOASIH TaxID=2607817 RepID=UPI0025D33FF1|nr:UDP-forming cellulose synthase catalytic subunit [Moorena sp. SIOASIH]